MSAAETDKKAAPQLSFNDFGPTDKDLIKKYMIKTIHVTKDGFFCNCKTGCEKCRPRQIFDHHTTPGFSRLRQICKTIRVMARESGKRYTCLVPDDRAIRLIEVEYKEHIDDLRRFLK